MEGDLGDDLGAKVEGDLGADEGVDVGARVMTLVEYRLRQDALLGFVIMYESTDKATLALLSLGVTQDLLKFM